MSTEDDIVREARLARLNTGLLNLAEWCKSRAEGQHDQYTTLTLLERKAAKLKHQVDRAGWDAVKDYHNTNSTKT
jgi:hypothetical protein